MSIAASIERFKSLVNAQDDPLQTVKASIARETPMAIPMATVPMSRQARISGIGEPPNLSVFEDVEKIQAALRAAERGDTWQLFTIYRDMIVGYGHLKAEWGKRKMVVVGQPHALIPHTKGNSKDEFNAEVIQQMIDKSDNWMDGLTHMLDGQLYPVSLGEKIYRVPTTDDELDIPVRYLLKRIEPVNYALLCFRLPYSSPGIGSGPLPNGNGKPNPDLVYDVDAWEPDLRIYKTLPNGYINFTLNEVYAPTRERHICHRGDMMSRAIRDNFGGDLRAILFWWLLATKDRDWFGLYMQKYGSPFLKGKADVQQKDTVEMLRNAFRLSTQIGGIVIDKKAELDIVQAAAQEGANAHKILIDVCNREVSKIVLGQELSSTAKNTGLGSGMAQFHGEVRDDIRLFDMMKLSETLERQLFGPYLRMNGLSGNPPKMIWGGKRDADAKAQADTLSQFALAGVEPTDEGLSVISERVGYGLQRKPIPEPAMAGGLGNGNRQ